MKILAVSRYTPYVCVAAMMLAGCGGPEAQGWNAPLQSSAKLSSESFKPAAGGSFTASYTGTYKKSCKINCGIVFRGTGSGTFIHRSRLNGGFSPGISGCGGFTFKSMKHPADTFNVATAPCRFPGVGHYKVQGGTGEFASASGRGKYSIQKHSNHTFTASWMGTLNF
ncbi:MAG: hypothetical protein JO113_08620 [Candidatus Eremiobacteraeota bacterium]|nr:hypothetical protein [Candidatus Eremiobacteraeota bacterium]